MDASSKYMLQAQDELAAAFAEMRHSFDPWIKKEQEAIQEGFEQLAREKKAFEEEHARAYAEFHGQRQAMFDSIRDERRRAELEATSATRQIKAERDDHRNKIDEDRGAIHKDVMQGKRRYALERAKFDQEFAAAEKERQKMFDHNTHTETMVEINVGGEIFEAARLTFTSQPGSYLERIMSGRVQAARDRDGRIFLDRDSNLFRIILNFLRDPATPPGTRDVGHSESLAKEADYLGIKFLPYPVVYALGGHNGSDHLSVAELLDVENQCWRTSTSMSTPRAYFGAEAYLSRLYAFGGQNLQYKALCATELMDCLRGTWFDGPDLNIPRRNCASAKLDGRIFAIGGYDGSSILASVEAYDPRMKNWMPMDKTRVARSAAAAAAYDGKLWVWGGTSGMRRRDGERYDPRTGTWELVGDMLEVRSALQAVTCLDRLYVMGGTDQSHNVHSSMECLGTSAGASAGSSWAYRKSMDASRVDFGATMLSDHIMVAGGQNGEIFDTTEFYRPEHDDWQKGPRLLSPRYGHRLLTLQL